MVDRRLAAAAALLIDARARARIQEKKLPPIPSSFSTSSWPEGLTVYPLAHGRGVPAGGFRAGAGGGMSFGYNSAVYASLNTIATGFMEPPLQVFRRPKDEEGAGVGRPQVMWDHSARSLLMRPNSVGPDDSYPVALTLRALGWYNQWCKHIDGNAYWLEVRAGDPIFGNVVALWPLSPAHTEPIGEDDPDTGKVTDPRLHTYFIRYYKYDPFPGIIPAMKLDPRNVIHFKLGVDPTNPRKGLGPVKFLAREIATDQLATDYTNNLLDNSAVPGIIVVPEDGFVDEEGAREIKDRMKSEFGGGGQGGVAVLSAGAKVEQFGYDPSKMSLGLIHKHVEERIGAVLNVPSMVAQLGAGLDQAAQFSNFHEAREMFAENTLLPLWLADSEVLTASLLPNFSPDPDETMEYDLSLVRALQGDVTAQYTRINGAVSGGWLSANEARAMVGMEPIDAKNQQVPLTQGEDNRFNIMVEQGLLTLNEVRESIGLPPIPDGDRLLLEVLREEQAAATVDAAQNTLGELPGSTGGAPPGQNAPGTGSASEGPRAPNAPAPGPPPPPENRRGSTIAPQEKALLLEEVFGVMSADEVFDAWKAARAEGKSLSAALLETA